MNDSTFNIALAQIDSIPGNEEKNIRKHVEMIRRARKAGAGLVVFPELSLSGYGIRDMNRDLAFDAGSVKRLAPLLEESRDITILCGGIEESPDFGLYNSAFCLEEGAFRSVHRKVYPPTYGMFEELRYFSPGSDVRPFGTKVGRCGLLICEDLWHPSLAYLLALEGAHLIVGIAASPTRLAPEEPALGIAEINSEQHRSLARLLSTYVVFCNRVGFEDGVSFWGGSEVVAPSGAVIARGALHDEDLVLARIDMNEVRRARQLSRHFLDENVPLVRRILRRIEHEKDR
jgi:predicted amidohydrolase